MDRQARSTSADAFSGSSTKGPGVTALPVNSVVVAPAETITLGCVRGGRGSKRTSRTSVPVALRPTWKGNLIFLLVVAVVVLAVAS